HRDCRAVQRLERPDRDTPRWRRRGGHPMKITAVDAFYLSMPEVLDIGDGSQDMLLIRVRAGDHTGWGECEASPLTSIAGLVCPMSHSACHPVLTSVLGQRLEGPAD